MGYSTPEKPYSGTLVPVYLPIEMVENLASHRIEDISYRQVVEMVMWASEIYMDSRISNDLHLR